MCSSDLPSFVETVQTSCAAAEAGAAAVVLAPPYYFPAGQPELREYLEHLTQQLPLPVVLYNMPSHTKLSYEAATVRAAAALPGVVGMKDSSADMLYLHRVRHLLADRPDFALLVGPEELLAEAVLLGCHGGVCGGANLFPRLYVALYAAAARGDLAAVRRLQAQVIALGAALYDVGRHGSRIIKALKCALQLEGICSDFMGEPFHRFRAEERERVRLFLDGAEAAVARRSC